MNVREMHIEVNQSSQQLGANKRRKLFSEEVDWILNKQQDRIIALSVPQRANTRGLAHDKSDLVRIKDLMVQKEVPLYYLSSSTVYASLPPLHEHMIADHSHVLQLCNNPVPGTTTVTYNLNRFRFVQSARTIPPYYSTLTITKDGTEIFNISNYVNATAENNYLGFNDKAQSYTIRNLVMQALNDLGEEVYWENYDMQFYPGELIIISPSVFVITMDATVVARTTATVSRQTHSGTGVWKANRLYSSDISQSLQGSAFSSTYYESPISELINKRLLIYTDKTFIVSKARVNYIRKPKKISLILGQDCELRSEWVQQQICDLSVEYIKEITADPNWEVKLQDNIRRTTI